MSVYKDIKVMPMKYPGDPNGGAAQCCNCRCAIAYVPAREYLN
ncbi:hypothetical protein [Spirosoma foliorum]|nr:hypothetical protein [Spirosoma foliorum]